MNQLAHKSELPSVANTGVASPAQLLCMAVEKDLDIAKLERLMALQEKWEKNNAQKSYFSALSGFQSEIPTIRKSKTASFPPRNGGMMVSYNYASLDDITESIRSFLVKFGLSYRFEQSAENGAIQVRCIVTHEDGHSESSVMIGYPDQTGAKNAIQQSASTVTYLRRYTLSGVLGIATIDEDIDGYLPSSENNSQNNNYADESHCQPDSPQIDYYPEENFKKNFSRFQKAISSGMKTPDEIIATIEAKAPLTDAQKQQLQNIKRG